MGNWRRALLPIFAICIGLSLIGIVLDSWVTFFPISIGTLAGFASLHSWLRDQGPVSLEKTLGLLKNTTAKRVIIGPITNAPADDWPIPWVTRDGPSHDSSAGGVSGPDALKWLLTAARPIVVIGDEGAGKSTLARQVATERSRLSGRAVIYVSLATWDPKQQVLDWTAREIATVTARRWNVNVAARHVRTLLTDGYVEVVFDALDEAPNGSVGAFVDSLPDSTMTGWFLFTRLGATELLPHQNRTLHDVVQLEALQAATVSDIIRAWGRSWRGLAVRVASHPDQDVPLLMRTPLFLTIAHTIASRDESPPSLLATSPPTPDAAHSAAAELMRWLVAAAVQTPGISDSDRRQRWLRNLARLSRRTGRDDFAWWDLAHATPWILPTVLGTAVAALPLMFLEQATIWAYERTPLIESLGPGVSMWIGGAVALVVAPLLAGLTGVVPRDARKVIRLVQSGPVRIGIAAGVMTAAFSAPGASSWLEVVLRVAVGMPTLVGIAWLLKDMGSGPHRWLMRLGVVQGLSQRAVPRRLGLTFTASRGVISLALGFLPLLVQALSYMDDSRGIFNRPFTDLLVGGGVIAALTFILLAIGTPSHSPRDHRRALFGNALFGATAALLAVGASIAYLLLLIRLINVPTVISETPTGKTSIWDWIAQATPHDRNLAIVFLVVTFCLLFLACAVVGVLVSSTGRYLLNLVILASASRLPWRLEEFLTWGHETGILRKSGQTYSFRHDSIRRYLDTGG